MVEQAPAPRLLRSARHPARPAPRPADRRPPRRRTPGGSPAAERSRLVVHLLQPVDRRLDPLEPRLELQRQV
ncbi:hypothetical protein FY030_07030 [Ornithinimicrobium pratense]|uniref:Uncharacterized protein n=1 Tax=Ornithinimicrobium pratense TaxID=2593973 RepID=A0A5J6V3I1_9MICO|nr:hypothetical protein FY030_07030 [Ornithinimicrobium pratense]